MANSLKVDIPSLRHIGASTQATGTVLSSKVGGAAVLDSAAGTMAGFRCGALLTSAANDWKDHAEHLAALVRSDGDRILQCVETYDTDDNSAASGFKQILKELEVSDAMDFSEVLGK
ncbi:hypothetical protein AB0H34_18420 [Saccharopolyspora shandongensis]|uniref:hypothetical protein n=1 Tax=Saccharopolyspora shandongensis TaxID=418495 RepID=UPI003400CE39